MGKINLLLIGFGPHAKRIYYPIIKLEENNYNVQIVYGIDLLEKKDDIECYVQNRGAIIPMYYIPKKYPGNKLHHEVENKLNDIVKTHKINGVIIATEPTSHTQYASWALENGLHILMDKPISAIPHASSDEECARQIIKDYINLKNSYRQNKLKFGKLFFNLLAQRRYHPAFNKMKELIHEVFLETNCPITSIQSFHSDGQWRLPSEIIDISYHSYNDGYGKCSHTGYHSLDMIAWLQEAAQTSEKQINNVDIFSNFTRPADFLSQITLKDYEKIFSGFTNVNKYPTEDYIELTKKFGEIDAFNSFVFKNNERTITLGSVNLLHNSFSQRGWLQPNIDLYKGNGRVRHESHFIEQGPFQAISFISYQAHQIDTNKKENIYDYGGEYHLDIHVFRNNNLFPSWKAYEKLSIKDIGNNILNDYSRGHQEDARRAAILEYIELIRGKKNTSKSDFLSHEKGTKLLSGVYLSAARRFQNKNPLVNITY